MWTVCPTQISLSTIWDLAALRPVLPTHSLPARSTSCSLVMNGSWEMLGLGEGHGEREGDRQGEEAVLPKSSSEELRAAGLARRQRGLHHSFWAECCMSFLALCSLRAEWRSNVRKAGMGSVCGYARARMNVSHPGPRRWGSWRKWWGWQRGVSVKSLCGWG